jgi:GT2 family glycosyltransferase
VTVRASVVTVNFNAGALLADCVAGVLASTVPVEVIVVDNGSTDGSVAKLRERIGGDVRVRILENERNLGFARANNLALPYARGEYVLFLNPDCLVRPDTIETMARVLDGRPDVGMAGCLVLNPDGSEQVGCRRSFPTPGRAFLRAFGLSRLVARGGPVPNDFVLRGTPLPDRPTAIEAISGSFMFVRGAAIDAVGPLDEGYFLHCEDLDWCARFGAAGQGVLFVPGVSVVHHQGECSRRRPVRVLWHKHRGMVRFYRKFLHDRYPRPLLWLVLAGIGLRFVMLVPVEALRGARAR